MRKIVAGLFISLDGVYEGPGDGDAFERAGWTMAYWDDAIGEYIFGTMAESDALLLGRVTYEGFEKAFANAPADDPSAAAMNGAAKYVASTTLDVATWQNSTLLDGDVIEKIKALKAEPGRNINMSGSGTLIQSLIERDLLDELDLLLYPVTVGTGKRLFLEGDMKKFTLAETHPFDSGVVLLRYQRDDKATRG